MAILFLIGCCTLACGAGRLRPLNVVAEDAGLPAAGFAMENFGTDDGLPQNSISAIIQSRQGYLWMGTYNGLVRFDGVRFKVFDASTVPPLTDGQITSLLESADGTLWLGHESGEVSQFREGRFHSVDLSERWPRETVVGIEEDAEGEIWVLNNQGTLLRVSDQTMLTPLNTPNDASSGDPSLLRDTAGNIWMTHRGVAGMTTAEGLTAIDFSDVDGTPYIVDLCASRDGGIWVITSTTLQKWKDGQKVADLGPCAWGDSFVACAMETKDGRLVVGTLDLGLFIVDPAGKVSHLTRESGLPHEMVKSLCEDHEGNLWVGTSGAGLIVLRRAKVVMANPPDDWRGRSVLSVAAGRDGSLWAGTEGAGLYQLSKGQWRKYGSVDGLPNPFIWSVLEDRQGTLRIGTWGEGLFVRSEGSFSVAPGWDELQIPVTSMLEASDGTVWVGTGRGLLKLNDTNVTWIYGNEDTSSLDVRTILEDQAGTIWFGTSGDGLGQLTDGSIKFFTTAEGLASNVILDLSADDDGTLWIGTLDNGLSRFKDGLLRTINMEAGLANNVIGGVADDGLGHLWLSSQRGVLRVSKEDLHRYADGTTDAVRCLVYGKRQGLATLAGSAGFSPSWCRTADDRLVFPTARGIAVVDPREVDPNIHPPPVQIEDIVVEGQTRTATDGADLAATDEYHSFTAGANILEMAPDERRLEIHYTALSFVAPEKVQFRYKLDPLEKDWVDAGTRRSANYSFVPPGNYTFHVIASNNDGVWNLTGAQLTVGVLPRFWETWWFRILLGIAAMGTVAGLVVLEARRRLMRKVERLESERAVERERTRIAQDIHDDLGASLTRILMLTQEGSVESEATESVEENIRQVHTTARELTREMDEIVWAVNPAHDTLDSLVNYLCRYAQTFLNAAHLRCRLDVPLDLPAWGVRTDVRHNLFLAFKEVLNNIVKHAGASEVRLGIRLSSTEMRVELCDDGRGLEGRNELEPKPENEDLDRIASGLGLEGIRRRLTRLGGSFDVSSDPGQGTTIEFSLPLKVMSAQKTRH